jgi:hypothetical protein
MRQRHLQANFGNGNLNNVRLQKYAPTPPTGEFWKRKYRFLRLREICGNATYRRILETAI